MSEQIELDIEEGIGKVGEYKFEPIKGYPMLTWKGKRPFTGTQYYPAQLKEVHGEAVDGWMNKIFWGDNLQVISHLLKEYRGKVQLVYIDPPFDSKADYKKKIQLKGTSFSNDQNNFEEKQYSDIWANDEYLQFMYERLIIIRELLSDEGCIYLHCDWHKNHYLRIIMDEVFGVQNYRNEITWVRTASHNDTNDKFSKVKDNILVFSKNSKVIFNRKYTPYDQSYIDSEWNELPSGRYYKSENMLDPQNKMELYDFHGTQARWRTSKEKMEVLWNAPQTEVPNSHGRIKLGKNGNPIKRCRIMFLDELEGVPLSDNWTDISYVAGRAKEAQNYPTQKPEKLLERIISVSSNKNDLIFDCFMGSGTTQAVAMKLGRRFIGADINLGALQTTTKRLLNIAEQLKENNQQSNIEDIDNTTKLYTGFEVYNVNHYDVFRNPAQARDLLVQALELNPLPKSSSIFDGEKDGWMIKIMPVNRIATRADLNEIISGLDWKAFDQAKTQNPTKSVQRIKLVCMGHEPQLANALRQEALPYKIDVEVLDILRNKQELQFKRDSEAEIVIENQKIVIQQFYPMNLLEKLSLEKQNLEDWRELVESIMIDFNYDGAVLEPSLTDIPEKNDLVLGSYPIPENAGTIRIKITDLLTESLEMDVTNG